MITLVMSSFAQISFAGRLKTLLLAGLLFTLVPQVPAQAQSAPLDDFCQVSQADASQKEDLRRAAFAGDEQARNQYLAIIEQQAQTLKRCRQTTWPNEQAVWLRLYACDLQPGILEAVLDRIVNLGYNQIYLEAFYSGQVLLPEANNPTPWPSVVQAAGYERRDMLAEAIEKGRQRGLETYAWVFTLNFGYSYAQRTDRQQSLARNGQGQDSATFANTGAISNREEVFIDPYSLQAQQDFQVMVSEVAKRRPAGILFDYVRYPRGMGPYSVVSEVEDLWIYGDASRQALFQRALNYQGLELMRRYISRGYLIEADVNDVARLYPNESEPLWQTRTPNGTAETLPASTLRPVLQNELWRLSVAHAVQGVVDFLTRAGQSAQQQGMRTGAVFFPGGNRSVGSGYDSRLQYWDRFPTWMTWHPMAYAICGHTGCILDEIRRVMSVAGPQGGQFVKPALAGIWGQSTRNRPSLEVQMQAIRRAIPEVNSVSHFAYSWQDPEFDRSRKFCQL
ncbi:MAG: family 10 glycosylhydrolase [Leptolyngbya sp. SIO1E4]|nr:family 10 glycosylhydrolase [Leptolyngbya sp. SIO1E4]